MVKNVEKQLTYFSINEYSHEEFLNNTFHFINIEIRYIYNVKNK